MTREIYLVPVDLTPVDYRLEAFQIVEPVPEKLQTRMWFATASRDAAREVERLSVAVDNMFRTNSISPSAEECLRRRYQRLDDSVETLAAVGMGAILCHSGVRVVLGDLPLEHASTLEVSVKEVE